VKKEENVMQTKRTKLIAARAKNDWTLSQASERIGCAPNTLSRWELGTLDPSTYSRQRLCLIYEKTAEQLGLEEQHISPSYSVTVDSTAQTYIDANLTTHLLSLITSPGYSPDEVQCSLEQALEAFRQNNLSGDVEQMQRDALHIVAMNSLTFCANTNISRFAEVALNQYAAGITACNYLSNGSREDRELTLAMITAYLPGLQTIVSEVSRYRKGAAGLLSQIWQIRSRMSFHLQGVEQAIRDGEEAVKYARENGNRTMLALLLRGLFGFYEFGLMEHSERRRKASLVIEEARHLVEQKQKPAIHLFVQSWVYTGVLKYEALCGMKQEMSRSLGKAEDTFFVSLNDKENRLPSNISYSQAHLLRHKAISHAYLGQQEQAFKIFTQELIDITGSFASRLPMTTSNRLGILSELTFSTLYIPKAFKDKELSMKLWQVHLEETKARRSESYFDEAYLAYRVMKGIWSDDAGVREVRDLLVHW
jgi:transcriptional regulator with XRE-family HTH domain